MKKIKYLAFYDYKDDEEKRNAQVSAINKIDYISSVFVSLGYSVEIISPSWTNKETGWYKKEKKRLSKNIDFIKFYTFGSKLKIGKALKYFFSIFQVLLYLMFNLKKKEILVVYHSNMIFPILLFLKMFKNTNYILEIEEIYQDIQSNNRILRYFENSSIKLATAYILSTNELKRKIPKNIIDSIAIEGNYQSIENKDKYKLNETIHLVYAGTFDPLKGGADFSVEIGKYLSNKYHLHIIGFGEQKDKIKLLKKIENANFQSQATITYDGLKTGKEYTDFLKKCHIGLSTQSSKQKFNESSFPSKVLSYMGHGLKVVSADIKVVKNSRIGEYITYYKNDDAASVAKIIENIEIEKVDNFNEIFQIIQKEIKIEMSRVLENVENDRGK